MTLTRPFPPAFHRWHPRRQGGWLWMPAFTTMELDETPCAVLPMRGERVEHQHHDRRPARRFNRTR